MNNTTTTMTGHSTPTVLGHDIKYQDFQKMSKEERKSLLRDIKIKRVLD